MKKAVILLIFLLAAALAKAEPVLILKQEKFQPGETLIGEIKVESGEFASSIQESSIKFSEGRRDAFFDYEIFPFNNSYFLYVYLSREGNFTISIQNILYKDAEGILKSHAIEKYLEVKISKIENTTNTNILSIRPGVVFTSKINPEIILENKGNKAFNITFGIDEISKKSGAKELYPLRPEKIILNISKAFSNFIIHSYSDFYVPIINLNLNQINVFEENISNKTNLKAGHLSFKIYAQKGKEEKETLELFNFENNTISSLKIKKELSIIKISDYKSQIIGGGSQVINFSFISNSQGYFQDNLTITFEENNLKGEIIIPIEIYILSENSSIENISINSNSQTCAQKGGIKCGGKCSGNFDIASDGPCCIGGDCSPADTKDEEGSSSSWLIGILIIAVVGIGGFILYKKVKSTNPKPADVLISDQAHSFEKRVSGGLSRS
jgi:hypothetical protein